MSFKTVAIITAIVAFVLACAYLFVGTLVVGRWQIQPTESVLLFGRRIGSLYLGLSVMYYLARSAPVSVARTALSAGTAVALSVLALLGVYEFAAGHAGPGILLSVAIESLIALTYIRVLLTDRKATIHS
jgi:hypothetical protein